VIKSVKNGHSLENTDMANRAKADESAVMTVPEAGAKLGLTRAAAYQAAARGEIPVIRFGKLMKVPKVAIERMLAGPDRIESPSKQVA
jgi:excisionase family DNA binding protein